MMRVKLTTMFLMANVALVGCASDGGDYNTDNNVAQTDDDEMRSDDNDPNPSPDPDEDPMTDPDEDPSTDRVKPVIDDFYLDPSPPLAGEELDIRWAIQSEEPVSCELDINGDSVVDYEVDDCLATTSQPHTFVAEGARRVRLFATNASGTTEADLQIDVLAPPLVVTSTADDGPGSLRATVAEAEPGDTVTFDLPRESVILLESQIALEEDITICGQNTRDTVIDGQGAHRHFYVGPGTTVTLCDMTLQNGLSELFDTSYGTKKAEEGGSIRADGDEAPIDLTLRNLVVKDSQAYTEEPNRTFDSGGCVFFDEGNLTVESSTFENCFASSGGAISAFGEVTISDSVFRGNESMNPGGALQIIGTADIRRSSFLNNFAGTGGGAMIIEMRAEDRPGPRGDGSSVIVNSSFYQNRTPAGGGAIFSYTSLTVVHSTFFDNQADESEDDYTPTYGGAIYQHADTNQDDYTLTVRNSVMYDNSSPEGPNIKGEVVFEGVNIVGDLTDAVTSGAATSDDNPLVAGVATFSGLPPVLEVNASSPAIDAVPESECLDWDGSPLTQDQLGAARPVNGACDVGAFERQ